jgi:hypothetical protein
VSPIVSAVPVDDAPVSDVSPAPDKPASATFGVQRAVWPSWISRKKMPEDALKYHNLPKDTELLEMSITEFDKCFKWVDLASDLNEPIPALPNKIDELPQYNGTFVYQGRTICEHMTRLHMLPEAIPTPPLFLAFHAGKRRTEAEGVISMKITSDFAGESQKMEKLISAYTLYRSYVSIFLLYNTATVTKNKTEVAAKQRRARDALSSRKMELFEELKMTARKDKRFSFAQMKVKERTGAFGFATLCDLKKDKLGYAKQKEEGIMFGYILRSYTIVLLRAVEAAIMDSIGMREREGHGGRAFKEALCSTVWTQELTDTLKGSQTLKTIRKEEEEAWAKMVGVLCIPQERGATGDLADITTPEGAVGPPHKLDLAAIKNTRLDVASTSMGWFSYYQCLELLIAPDPFVKHTYAEAGSNTFAEPGIAREHETSADESFVEATKAAPTVNVKGVKEVVPVHVHNLPASSLTAPAK